MFAQFRFLDGPETGETRVVADTFASIGTDPTLDVPIPHAPPGVAARHVLVFKHGGQYVIRDLGTGAGTFVDGVRVRSDTPIEPNSVIQLGADGPRIQFSITAADLSMLRKAAPASSPVLVTTRPPVSFSAMSLRPGRGVAIGALLLMIAVSATALVRRESKAAKRRLEDQKLVYLTKLDSVTNVLELAGRQHAFLASPIASVRSEIATWREMVVQDTTPTNVAIDSVRKLMNGQESRRTALLQVANLDPKAPLRQNGSSVALVITDLGKGKSRSGAAFSVEARGDTVYLVTAKSVVAGAVAKRRRGPKFQLYFPGDTRPRTARLVRIHDSADVALIKTVMKTSVPTAKRAGAAVLGGPGAVIGFPAGADSAARLRREGVQVGSAVAIVSAVGEKNFEVKIYGNVSASGSLVLSAGGEMLGLVTKEADDQRLTAIPARIIWELIENN